MNKHLGTAVLVAIAGLILLSVSIFTVDERQSAIVFRLGEIVASHDKPGLYFKLPIVDRVRHFDSRILTIDTDDPDLFLTSEKKNVLVDSFVKWRIIDVKQYYVSVQGDETRAAIRLTQTVNDTLRAEFGKRTIHDVVSGERDDIMNVMREKADGDARKIGVQVIDVRLKRVDLPQEVSDSVYGRMQAERTRVAKQLRSLGTEESEKIRADADRQREVLIAEAYRDAQKIKGEGDAKASSIYASAFQADPEFFAFYRSLEAYRQSFKNKGDVLILDPSSDFFKYMKGSGGGGRR
jgi:membrane protease subunit HflC